MTVHGLFMFATCCIVAAAGLDTTHLYAARSQLQATADATAHAAIYQRHKATATDATARAAALALARVQMPEEVYGPVASDAQVEFGRLDSSGSFVPTSLVHSAARVTLGRTDSRDNPVQSFFFRMVGIDNFDVVTQAVFVTDFPGCLSQGFVANGRVDMQSNNDYYRGFCIHSNSHVEMNSNNWFQYGTVVSMPDITDLTMPNSGWQTNEGLSDALREGSYDLRILDRLRVGAEDSIYTAVTTEGSADFPSYIDTSAPTPPVVNVSGNRTSFTPSSFPPGRVHRVRCSGSGTITLTGGTYSNVVIDTNCNVKMSGRVQLDSSILMTSSTSSTSIQTDTGGGTNGLELGRPDDCGAGGGAQIITRGGFRSSAALVINGGQILALGDVNFAANAVGKGASIVSDGQIDSTSNMSMSACLTGLEDMFQVPYFRLAG